MATLIELSDLKDRVSLITGGAGFLGSVLAETLAELGSSIIVLDNNTVACQRVAQMIQEKYAVRAYPIPVDLANEDETKTVPRSIVDHFGRLDILVNCAAMVGTSDLKGWSVPFEEQGVQAWRKAIEVNLTAAFLLSQGCAALLRDSGHGSIINIASIYGLVGPDMSIYSGTNMGNPAAYGSSKAGLLQLTRYLATVLAPHIRVNAITPGGIARNQPVPFVQEYLRRTPLRRMATEDDFKGAIAFLASDLSSYMTGQNLIIDGGWTVW